MSCEDIAAPTRRRLLGTAGAFFAWPFLPRWASAAGARDPRFVTIILRGALDGLSAVAPIGDPDYVGLRETIALSLSGERPALPLDAFFALHPAMPHLARLYRSGQALIVHACATGYRERSHFDGQDVLESGLPVPGRVESGWLNRAVAALPKSERIAIRGALGVGSVPPLVARGPASMIGWAPPRLPTNTGDLADRLIDLYAMRDPVLARALAQGIETDKMALDPAMRDMARGAMAGPDYMKLVAAGTAKLMAAEAGPRVGALAFDGWDTHANAGGATGRLAQLLAGLDGALAAFEENFAASWKDVVIAIVTEFGRTARVNGTVGTDHGTATVAFLVGGAVKGGRIVADWPGLKEPELRDGRDLAATTDLRAVLKGVLADHLGLSAKMLGETVFPGTAMITPMRGLLG